MAKRAREATLGLKGLVAEADDALMRVEAITRRIQYVSRSVALGIVGWAVFMIAGYCACLEFLPMSAIVVSPLCSIIGLVGGVWLGRNRRLDETQDQLDRYNLVQTARDGEIKGLTQILNSLPRSAPASVRNVIWKQIGDLSVTGAPGLIPQPVAIGSAAPHLALPSPGTDRDA